MENKHDVKISWTGDMSFSSEINGHYIQIDADTAVGGKDKGPRPKPFMLLALAGCTGMDVISILRKMRVEVEDFNVKVEGKLTDEHPKHYKSMHVVYEFKGKDLPVEKLQKAISLSEERYCGVSHVYKKAMPLTSEIIVTD